MNNKLQEQKWQAESDAHTMAAYQEILADKARMKRAVNAAKSEASRLTQRATAMQNAAKCSNTSKSSSKKK